VTIIGLFLTPVFYVLLARSRAPRRVGVQETAGEQATHA
jgi:hypothetical protein